MSVFSRRLAACNPDRASWRERTWLFVPYDQLTDQLGMLAELAPAAVGIVLVECEAKASRRPYHKQKLALLLTNLRHFALEQAMRGVAVMYLYDRVGYANALHTSIAEVGPVTMMEAAERELRTELAPVIAAGGLRVVPHTGWLTTMAEFLRFSGEAPPWRMDAFYRGARRARDVLMDGGAQVGGKFSFDSDNRQPWRGQPPAPVPPTFAVDDVTAEVCALVETRFASHPGQLNPATISATAEDAEAAWHWALRHALPSFGPYEDAMSTRSSTLFHTLISPLLNLHRLVPARVVADAMRAPIELPSKEGFIRQVLGWREFVHHVHVATDGFRTLAPVATRGDDAAGDAGYARYRGERSSPPMASALRGAAPARLGAGSALPAAFWGQPSGLRCLDHVVADVWRTGHSHHITRLMVLGNIASLLDVSPRQLTDWFWIAYIDAYDWVVEPNVLGMATFATGDVMTTKPYIAGSGYIDRMSDFCKGCQFAPKTTCPLPTLYWAHLDRNSGALAGNHRMAVPLAALRKRTAEQRAAAAATFAAVTATLARGEVLAAPAGKPRKL
ncbi:cryptochrome/photolyase family protein [soil metagenome]